MYHLLEYNEKGNPVKVIYSSESLEEVREKMREHEEDHVVYRFGIVKDV